MKKGLRLLAFGLCMALVCGLLAACGATASSTAPSAAPASASTAASTGDDASAAAPAAASGETVKFAYIAPLTGDSAQYGLDMQKAIELKVKQVNEAGGINGATVVLDVYDDKNDPKEAVNLANRIVEDDEVLAVFGPFSSTNAMAISPIFQREGILQYAITASHPDVTAEGDYIFRGVRTQQTETMEFVDFAYNELGKRDVAILYINNDFGTSVSNIFEKGFTEAGGNIVAVENFIEGQTKDFAPMLTKIKAAKPDMLFIVAFYNDTATVLNQADTLDLDCDFMGVTAIVRPETIELAGDNANGLYALSGFVLDAPRENFQQFRTAYSDAYGEEVNSFTMNAYDGACIVMEGVEKVGADRKALRDYVAGVTDYEGLAGVWGFDENRNPSKPLFRMQVEDGAWVVLE